MQINQTAFAEPTWANGEEIDVTGELFPDLDADGDTKVTLIYREVNANLGGHYFNRDISSDAVVDGVRIEAGSTTEWRDREWLSGAFGAAEVSGADAYASVVSA